MDFDHETQVLCALNPKNVLIPSQFIEETLLKYGIQHKVKHLYNFQRAMVHVSYLVRNQQFYRNNKTRMYKQLDEAAEPLADPSSAIPLQPASYERLEFLGDSMFHLAVADYLFHRYKSEDEGFMTRLRTKIEEGDTLSKLAKCIGLNKYILLSQQLEQLGARNDQDNILEDAFEAFIGAFYLDVGEDIHVCRQFIIKMIETHVDLAQIIHTDTNFKDIILRYFHKQRWQDPIYKPLDVSGPESKKVFTMCIKRRLTPRDEGDIIGIGTSSSKKKAEQMAAKAAAIEFGLCQDDNMDSDNESCEEYSSGAEEEVDD